MKNSKMKKQKYVTIYLLFLVTFLWVGSTFSASATTITPEQVAQIEEGMTYDEMVALLGEPDAEVGSGFFIVEWSISDGTYLHWWMGGEMRIDTESWNRYKEDTTDTSDNTPVESNPAESDPVLGNPSDEDPNELNMKHLYWIVPAVLVVAAIAVGIPLWQSKKHAK